MLTRQDRQTDGRTQSEIKSEIFFKKKSLAKKYKKVCTNMESKHLAFTLIDKWQFVVVADGTT